MQARATHALAIGLMLTVGLSMLGWYYSKALGSHSRAPALGGSTAASPGQREMPLPSLGRIDALPVTPPPEFAGRQTAVESSDPATPEPVPAPPPWLAGEPIGDSTRVASVPMPGPTQPNEDRRLSAAVFAGGTAVAAVSVPAGVPGTQLVGTGDPPAGAESGNKESLSALLRSAPTPAVLALQLPDQRLLLAKGAFIDCTLETAIDSTLPGMTTCITATDTFGADGTVVLMERGTRLIGELRGQVQLGTARVFVVWNEARTPTGVVVPLASPGADELGRAGLPGNVNRHFWERFGAAILISSIGGAVQSVAQAGNHSSGAVVYSPGGPEGIATEVLKSTVGIAPTVIKRQGDRIQVLVARDLDFRTVYELRPSAGGR